MCPRETLAARVVLQHSVRVLQACCGQQGARALQQAMALARRSPSLTRRAATPAARRARGPRGRAAARAAADDNNNNASDNDVSDAFSRELRRRGVGSSEGDESREAFLERPSEEEPAERDERMFGQLERTRQMQVRVRWR